MQFILDNGKLFSFILTHGFLGWCPQDEGDCSDAFIGLVAFEADNIMASWYLPRHCFECIYSLQIDARYKLSNCLAIYIFDYKPSNISSWLKSPRVFSGAHPQFMVQ